MSCDVGEVALPASQLILQSFRCFTYITVHSPTLLLLLLHHKLFTQFTCRAAHAYRSDERTPHQRTMCYDSWHYHLQEPKSQTVIAVQVLYLVIFRQFVQHCHFVWE